MLPGFAALLLLSSGIVQVPAGAPPITITTAARSIAPGEVVVVTVTTAEPATTVRATAFGRALLPFDISANRQTWRFLAGIDLELAPGRYPVAIDATVGSSTAKRVRETKQLVVVPKQFQTRRLTVDTQFVEPPAGEMARIEREAITLGALWTASAPDRLWTGPFSAPVPEPANSAFGSRSIFNGQPRSPHSGADFSSKAGTPIHSPNGGKVVLAADLFFTGQTVVIDHGLGLVSLFAHLSAINVQSGDVVTPGQVVGLVGATGRVTGAHLHWSLRATGARVDPLSLLAALGPQTEGGTK